MRQTQHSTRRYVLQNLCSDTTYQSERSIATTVYEQNTLRPAGRTNPKSESDLPSSAGAIELRHSFGLQPLFTLNIYQLYPN